MAKTTTKTPDPTTAPEVPPIPTFTPSPELAAAEQELTKAIEWHRQVTQEAVDAVDVVEEARAVIDAAYAAEPDAGPKATREAVSAARKREAEAFEIAQNLAPRATAAFSKLAKLESVYLRLVEVAEEEFGARLDEVRRARQAFVEELLPELERRRAMVREVPRHEPAYGHGCDPVREALPLMRVSHGAPGKGPAWRAKQAADAALAKLAGLKARPTATTVDEVEHMDEADAERRERDRLRGRVAAY